MDSLYLEVTAPGGEAIFSETAIPKQVKIDSVTWHGKEITTYFMSDECEEENYYVLTLSWESEGGNVRTYFLSGFECGLCNQFGEGVEKDLKKSSAHLRSCSDHGLSFSDVWLGQLLLDGYGDGVEVDKCGAACYFKKSADQGY